MSFSLLQRLYQIKFISKNMDKTVFRRKNQILLEIVKIDFVV